MRQASDIEVWEDKTVAAIIDAHPDELRAIPQLAASLGMREGELFGLAEEDIDLDGEKVVRVRRQVKRLGKAFIFALPKNDRERIIPLSDWDVMVIRRHVIRYPPRPYTLPWEKTDGKHHTCPESTSAAEPGTSPRGKKAFISFATTRRASC